MIFVNVRSNYLFIKPFQLEVENLSFSFCLFYVRKLYQTFQPANTDTDRQYYRMHVWGISLVVSMSWLSLACLSNLACFSQFQLLFVIFVELVFCFTLQGPSKIVKILVITQNEKHRLALGKSRTSTTPLTSQTQATKTNISTKDDFQRCLFNPKAFYTIGNGYIKAYDLT